MACERIIANALTDMKSPLALYEADRPAKGGSRMRRLCETKWVQRIRILLAPQ
jgi:hypothetical protein